MPLTIDQDDTQVLEFDSPHSGSGDVFLGGETLPPDYGETQRVDSCDDQLGVGFEGWGKTQVIDEFEETEVVRDDDEDEGGQSERTELVADEEGLVDDFVGEVSSGVRTKVADLVDPDASTDEEGGCGHDEAEECSRKSYVALPVAAPQSSGFANVCSMTCIPIGKNSALNTAGSKKDEIIFDPDADNSFKFVEGYGRDHHPYQEEETEIRSELNKEKLSSLSPLRCSQDAAAAAGLSYISSQEPGAQSQAMALGVVDKFLSVNNEGLSPGINKENTDKSISLPIASVKRAQCFVRKTDKNTERKVQVFDWIDSLEDDGGGGLFSRRKSSFDCKGSKQVSRTCQKLASLEKSKNLFDELKERTNTDTMEQLQKSDVDISDEGVYNCGPATQMAAEAMQALGRSSHVNFELSSGGEVISRTCSRNSSTRKRSNRSKGIKTRLKPQNIPKSSTKSCNSSRKQSTKLRTKMVSEDSTADITKKSDGNCAVISVDNGKYASSIIGETMKNMLDKEVEKPTVPMILCKQPSVGAKCVIGASEMYTSPVAHRTRRSKAAELLNVNKTLSNDPCKITSRINSRARRTTEVEDDFFSNASAAPKANKNGCNISLTGTIGLPDAVEMERVHVEEAEAAHDSDADRESKRRKTNNHSKSDDPIAPTIANPAIQKKKRKVFIRSFAEILDTVKRRRRSVSSSNKLESDGMPSNSRKMRNESGIRTRSSLLSDILKPYFACKAASDGTANTYSVSSVKQVADNGGLETSKESAQSRLHAEVKNTSQCGLRCSPTTSRNAVSPVCNSQGASRLSFHKSSSRSPISRELIRLEASYTSPSKLNDVRRRKDMACFQICFSNHLSQDVIKQQKKILKRLGIQDVSTSLEATHFVADRFVRTRNMLEAMAMGKPVVTPMWLESCGQASSSIDEKNYILRDAKKEKEIGFSMPVSLARAGQHPLLQGKRVLVTRNARPNRELISSLVKVAGGQPLKRIELSITEEDELPDDLLILSAEEDYAVCAPLLEKGAVVFSSELLLNGIVIQKLEFERHHLFLNQVTR